MPDTERRSAANADALSLAREFLATTPYFGRIAWRAAQECGLGSPERCRMLLVLGGGPLRAGLLAQHLKLSPAAVTELVEVLVADGLVRRETDPHDRRAVVLALTAEGKRQRQRYEHAAASALAQVIGRLTPARRRRLRAAFADLRAAFGAADPEMARGLHRAFTASSRAAGTLPESSRRERARAR